jgi:hypothetical protein
VRGKVTGIINTVILFSDSLGMLICCAISDSWELTSAIGFLAVAFAAGIAIVCSRKELSHITLSNPDASMKHGAYAKTDYGILQI